MLGVLVAAVCVTATVAVVDAGPAGAAATFKVTAKTSARTLVLDQAAKVSGTVTPTYAGQKVVLRQLLHGKYQTVASRLVHRGQFTFTVRPSAAGVFTYRVYVGRHGARSAARSSTVRESVYRWHYLADMDSAGENDWWTDTAEVDGTTYTHSLVVTVYEGTFVANYNLARKCSTMTGVAGLSDDATPDDTFEFGILGDGNQLFTDTLQLGQHQTFKLNVQSVLRLELTGTPVSNQDVDELVYGNPRVLCMF